MDDWKERMEQLEGELARVANDDDLDVELALATILRAQQDLYESETRYRLLIEQSSDGIWRTESNGPVPVTLPPDEQARLMLRHFYIAHCNRAMGLMYGYPDPREMRGLRIGKMFVEADPASIRFLETFASNGYRLLDAVSHEVDRDGKPRTFLNSIVGRVENGLLVRCWGTQRDITPNVKDATAVVKSIAPQLDALAADARLPSGLQARLKAIADQCRGAAGSRADLD